jgi:hypothetical protein
VSEESLPSADSAAGLEPVRRRMQVEERAPWPAFLVSLAGAGLSFAAMWFVGGPMVRYLAVSGCALVLWYAVARRRPIAFTLGWMAPPALIMGLLFWHMGGVGDYVTSGSFDRDVWISKRDADFGDRTRLRMVESLRASGRLEQLTREEAVALLGPQHQDWWGLPVNEWIWRLGPDRGIGIDSSWLLLHFGPDGRVESHRIIED